jgi:putative oxygen-independent coproporphyrinogen III oxidase
MGFGVYVHIPFCASRCDYCAFATWTDRHHLIDSYLEACIAHIELARGGTPIATSVFFGGGTPSLVPASGLMRVLAAVRRTADAEVTVECNPDTVTEELAATYVAGGVNRISLGVQSMVPHVLQALGRTHQPENVADAVRIFRAAGIGEINLDLIYGGVGESLDDWHTTLVGALDLSPDHISAYGLTVEAGTPLALDPARHPDDDDQADKYLMADEMLVAGGLENYEVSNWARPGSESRHNRLYWQQGEYLGVGCAAHSHQGGVRSWNVRTPDRYIDLVAGSASVVAGHESLDVAERRLEALQLALRMREGVPAESLPAIHDAPELEGLIEVRAGVASLTVHGRLLANEVAVRLRS